MKINPDWKDGKPVCPGSVVKCNFVSPQHYCRNLCTAPGGNTAECGDTCIPDLHQQIDKERLKFQEALDAEHKLSDAYIRLRQILGAMDPPELVPEKIWEYTETKAALLVDELRSLKARTD